MLSTLSYVTKHPLNRAKPMQAVGRYLQWQVRSRLSGEILHPWIEGTTLAVRRGMWGATGNIYCGLHEFADMGFLLHFLKEGDLFLDIGANVGTYTVLAAGVRCARCLSFEPDPVTLQKLRRNIEVNQIQSRVTVFDCALGKEDSTIKFSVGMDTVNHVLSDGEQGEGRIVPVRRLDGVPGATAAVMAKLDVEGYEAQVLEGATSVLASPNLMAVEIEARDERVVAMMTQSGFSQYSYDPFQRKLLPQGQVTSNNALWLRDRAQTELRLNAAAPVTIFGQRL